jgi:hypothetical protein
MRAALLCAVVAASACLFGLFNAAPKAAADSLPNGYSVTCTPNGAQLICNISGCPRVHADEAGDVVHVRINGGTQDELSKGCNSATTTTYDGGAQRPQTISIQGCRKHSPASDDCGAWSDYHYNPPAPAAQPGPANAGQLPVRCTGAGPDSGKTLPPGSTCAAAAPPAPAKCPDGSKLPTALPGQPCSAPTNAIQLVLERNGLNAHVAVINLYPKPVHCTYAATKTKGVGPQEVDRSLDIGAGPGTDGQINDMLWPPPLTSYNIVVTCTGPYDGKTVTLGQLNRTVNG